MMRKFAKTLKARCLKKKQSLNYLIKDVPRSLSENLEVLRHTSVKVEIEFTKGTTSLLGY
jgi:hypothetical protein